MNTDPTRTPAVPGVLDDPMRDRGVAFTAAQREALGLTGRLPAAVLTLEEQAERAYRQLGQQGTALAKNVYLEQLHDRNETLYYRVLSGHLTELLPIVYDPTVGEAIEKYSHEYRRPRGIYLSVDQPDDIAKAFATLGLGPADVDPATGHRRYGTDQISTAQVIKRFRSLDMPLEEIHAVITTPDLAARNELIAGHLRRLEMTLARTQQAAASLRDILEPPAGATPVAIEHRRIPATPAAAVSEVIDVKEASAWYQGALGELYAVLAAHKVTPAGPGGAIYANDLFSYARGEATVFVPCAEPVRATGRMSRLVVPEVELAVTVHTGALTDADLAYGSLATYVTDHALAVEGPIREYYVLGPQRDLG